MSRELDWIADEKTLERLAGFSGLQDRSRAASRIASRKFVEASEYLAGLGISLGVEVPVRGGGMMKLKFTGSFLQSYPEWNSLDFESRALVLRSIPDLVGKMLAECERISGDRNSFLEEFGGVPGDR
jgi:hypothetical protein